MSENKRLGMKELSELEKRPQYFNFFLECCDMIAILDDQSAGRTIRAIADYFSYGDEPNSLSRNEQRVFDRIKKDIDKSCDSWAAKVEGGKRGAAERWKENNS